MSAREQSSVSSGSGLATSDSDTTSRRLPPPAVDENAGGLPRLSGSETVIKTSIPSTTLPASPDSPSRIILDRLFPPAQESGSSIGTNSPCGIELDHFRIEERIGMGGMGAVFRAVDTRLQRLVALKLLAPAQSHDEGAVKRFQNEARAAARLDHDNVARVHYIGEERGLHFIAFEFVTGLTVRELIRNQHHLSVSDAINYALQIAAALKHTSAMGVVHRDIKPSNIIITPNGRAKLVDLGLARNDTTESQADLTLPGTTLGTFDYISPEQAKDPRSVDVRSDIYSLGCTLYHMLSGQPPYPEGTLMQKLLHHQGTEAPDPASVNRRIPDFVSAIVRKMMNSDRNNRHQNADHLIRDLTHAAGHLGLRGINPEGLVWVASKSATSGWMTDNAGWIATIALLLSVVGVLHQFPEIGLRLAGVPVENRSMTAANGPGGSEGVVEQTTDALAHDEPGHVTSVKHAGSAALSTELPSGIGPSAEIDPGRSLTSRNAAPFESGIDVPFSPLPLVGSEINVPGNRELIPNMQALLSTNTSNADASVPQPPFKAASPETSPAESTLKTSRNTEPDTVTHTSDKPENADSGEKPLPVALFTGDASLDRHYKTLEAACAAAEDGSTIELQFSDTLVEKSFRVTRKNLTIRAGRGHTPTIEFVPSEIDSTDSTARMITLNAGPLRIVNVNLQMTIPDRPSADRYSLFGMSRPGLLAMDHVAVTVVNPGRVQASIVDVSAEFGRMPADMPTTPVTIQREELGLHVRDCVFRGQAGFADIAWPGQAVFSMTNCVAALDGGFLQIYPVKMPATDQPLLAISLEHFTARLTEPFLKSIGPVSVNTQSVECSVRNSILSLARNVPFVLSDASIAPEDARRMVVWRGERNFFDDISHFWSLESSDDLLSWDQWQELWQPNGNVGSKNLPIDWIVKQPFDEAAEFSPIQPDTYQLGPGIAEVNPAIQGATDGSDAGADLAELPWGSEKEPVSDSPDTKSEPSASPASDDTATTAKPQTSAAAKSTDSAGTQPTPE